MAALTGPVALHRMVTGLKLKSETVAWASRLVAAALALLLAMTSLGLLVVLRQITGSTTAFLLSATLTLWCALCWSIPAYLLRRHDRLRATARARSELMPTDGEVTARHSLHLHGRPDTGPRTTADSPSQRRLRPAGHG